MKRIILAAVALFSFGFANAQAKEGQVSKGKWLIEVNTGFGDQVGNTSLSLTSSDGVTAYNIGAEEVFIKDNLAVKTRIRIWRQRHRWTGTGHLPTKLEPSTILRK